MFLRKIFLIFLVLFYSCLSSQTKFDIDKNDPLLKDVIKEGTLGNEILQRDTMKFFKIGLSMKGCSKFDSYKPYVLQMPKGEIGSRLWRERWIAKSENKYYYVDFTFVENELGVTILMDLK
ncbi:MAG: hypothetical protein N2258_00330 [Brevinematales bacterium]|nr:hypothetical protein [Brevinematales bacterium]